ncbi:MAG: DUF3006 domain-containing protein [Oscillospiraceae bacterium]|jgi:hypothetical protein
MDRLLVVDRLEGEMALCLDEAKNQTILPLADLPPGVKEGDWLRQTPQGWMVDAQETQRRREKNRELFQRLLKKNNRPQ